MWLALVALILAIRFPVKFWLEPPFLMDFEVFRAIGIRILQGDATHLYAPVQTAPALFKYAPVWALPWIPFGWLSSHMGAVLWSGLNVLWLVLTLRLAASLCRAQGLTIPWWSAPVTALLLARILSAEFLNGQTDLLWACLTTSGICWAAANRQWPAALAFALAISLKLPAALFLLYVACQRHWSLLGRTLLCLAALNLIGAWLLVPSEPLHLFADWLTVLRSSAPERAFEIGAQSLLALVARFASADGFHLNILNLPRAGVVALTGLIELVLFGLVALRRPASTTSLRWALDSACLTACMALFSPTCWLATYSVLLFPVFVLLAMTATPAPAGKRSGRIGLIATIVCSLLTHRKVWRWIGVPRIGQESYTFLVAVIPAWLALVVSAALWRYSTRPSTAPHPQPAPPPHRATTAAG